MKNRQTLMFHKSDVGVVSIVTNESDLYAKGPRLKPLNFKAITVSYSNSSRPLGYVRKYLELKRNRQDGEF